jgi:hypothetical protein
LKRVEVGSIADVNEMDVEVAEESGSVDNVGNSLIFMYSGARDNE